MFYNTETKLRYPTYQSIRSAHPNTCWPVEPNEEILNSFNIVYIYESTPTHDSVLEEAVELEEPILIDGRWTQQWLIRPKYQTEEEKANALLSNLNDTKAKKNEEINMARLEANTSFFMHLGKRISCDTLSRSDIDATNGMIVNSGSMPEGWVGFWKTADNEYIPITTVEDWKNFYQSMFQTGSQNFIKAQTLKAMVNAATSVEAVNAINWETPIL